MIWNPFSPGYFDNPYPHLRKCLEENPVHLGVQNSWMIFDYEEVSKILRSPDFMASDLSKYLGEKEPYILKGASACPFLKETTEYWPMYLDGDVHKTMRVLLGKVFGSIPFKNIIRDSMDEVNAPFEGAHEFDLTEYCGNYIYAILKKAFGLSNMTYEDLTNYSNKLARVQDIYIPKQVYREINDSMLWGVEVHQKTGLLQLMREHAPETLNGKSDQVLYSLFCVSVMAAFETSKDNLSMAMYHLLLNPKLQDQIIEMNDRELNIAIEEIFRFTSPLQFTIRTNRMDYQVGDVLLPAGTKIYLCLASANRDTSVFSNPDELDLSRNPNNHLSFGGGAHFCIGAQIARTELRTCLKPMLEFLKSYRVVEDSIEWNRQIFMRHLKKCVIVNKKV